MGIPGIGLTGMQITKEVAAKPLMAQFSLVAQGRLLMELLQQNMLAVCRIMQGQALM